MKVKELIANFDRGWSGMLESGVMNFSSQQLIQVAVIGGIYSWLLTTAGGYGSMQ